MVKEVQWCKTLLLPSRREDVERRARHPLCQASVPGALGAGAQRWQGLGACLQGSTAF